MSPVEHPGSPGLSSGGQLNGPLDAALSSQEVA